MISRKLGYSHPGVHGYCYVCWAGTANCMRAILFASRHEAAGIIQLESGLEFQQQNSTPFH